MPRSVLLDHIEILEGESLFYSTQAIGGAVDIVTEDFSAVQTGEFTAGGDNVTCRLAVALLFLCPAIYPWRGGRSKRQYMRLAMTLVLFAGSLRFPILSTSSIRWPHHMSPKH